MAALSYRSEALLKTLIERYISDGQPVGSRTLAKQAGLELSPATVRNVMADLEELGLISSPHTSAGRVPTARGYRVFVDSLIKVRPLNVTELRHIEGELGASQDPQQLVETASALLSQVTRLAGLVMAPKAEQAVFRQIEFLTLSANRILVILITLDGRVHNRIIQAERAYSAAELVEASNYFNRAFAGMSLTDVKSALLAEMQRDSEAMQAAVRIAMDMARGIFAHEPGEGAELVVKGEANLLNIPELGDVHKLRKLLDAFSTKHDLLLLLDQCMRVNGVQIFIGQESGYLALEECSVVTAPYRVDGQVVGTLGVIGPTRMAYDQVIAIVDVTARLLGGALSADGRA
ncbi:MAG: heat-inducible transcriptional repressor HrcA [Gammaproteobacteria bacterium]|nr:heat-inducible transcriptional repressor HrcA [Gammaproteobacteria bacterium]